MNRWGMMLGVGLLLTASGARAQTKCMWGGTFYGPGAMSCQAGAQARCVDGRWQMTGTQCAGQATDPSGEENQPGVVQPRVGDPRVVGPGGGWVKPPSVPPGGDH